MVVVFHVLFSAPASSSDSSSSLEQEKYLQAILNSIPVYFKMNGNNTLTNRSLIGLSPGTFLKPVWLQNYRNLASTFKQKLFVFLSFSHQGVKQNCWI